METQDQREDSAPVAPGLERIASQPIMRMQYEKAAARTPIEMLDRALTSGMSVEVIQKLMDLAERHERNVAKRDFDRAIAGAKAKMPIITKNRTVDFTGPSGKRTNYIYEDLAGVLSAVEPVLAEFDLGVRFTSHVDGGTIVVTCILFHGGGHEVSTSLPGPYDNSGNKNPIQAMGSTVTYLQRYTLKVALGLAAAQDDDGQAAAPRPDEAPQKVTMIPSNVEAIEAHVKATGANREKLLKVLKVESFDQLYDEEFSVVIRELDLAKERREAKAKSETADK